MTAYRVTLSGRNAADPRPMSPWQRERMAPPFADDRGTWSRVWSHITGASRSDWIACLCVALVFVVLLEGGL